MSSIKDTLTFAEGVERIKKASKESGYDFKGQITTSRDDKAKKATDLLAFKVLNGNFKKFQLPFYFDKPAQAFVSIGAPDTDVPLHSHDEGDGLRYIVSGSIIYEGKELTQGDWMFIPAGKPYSFKVGAQGVVAFYCYCCCCAS
jgi:hypothetical protein